MSGTSANSVINAPGKFLGQLGNDASGFFGGSNSIFRKPFGSSPAPEAPPAPPDPAQATNDALQKQLNQELQMRRSSSLQTGGTGLIAGAQTQTASQLLLGT